MMNFREIELDLPLTKESSVAKDLNDEDFKSFYKNIWKKHRANFSLETRWATAFLERTMEKVSNLGIWKVIIECVEVSDSQRVLILEGVLVYQVSFNFNSYSVLPDEERKQEIVRVLAAGIEKLPENYPLLKEALSKSMDLFRVGGFQNRWTWKKIGIGKTSLQLDLDHRMSSIDFVIVMQNENGNIVYEKTLLSDVPDEFRYAEKLGKLVLENDSIVLYSKRSNIVFKHQINSL